VLHLLTKRRQDLVAARTQTINRLHRLLMDLVPGGARRNLTANRAAGLLARVRPTGAPAVTRWQLATELVTDVRQLEQRIAVVEVHIKTRSRNPGRPWWSAGQAYYQRKLAEGKSPKEALRCLKRRLSDAVYRCLLADQHH
jgi:hypothetical protein